MRRTRYRLPEICPTRTHALPLWRPFNGDIIILSSNHLALAAGAIICNAPTDDAQCGQYNRVRLYRACNAALFFIRRVCSVLIIVCNMLCPWQHDRTGRRRTPARCLVFVCVPVCVCHLSGWAASMCVRVCVCALHCLQTIRLCRRRRRRRRHRRQHTKHLNKAQHSPCVLQPAHNRSPTTGADTHSVAPPTPPASPPALCRRII